MGKVLVLDDGNGFAGHCKDFLGDRGHAVEPIATLEAVAAIAQPFDMALAPTKEGRRALTLALRNAGYPVKSFPFDERDTLSTRQLRLGAVHHYLKRGLGDGIYIDTTEVTRPYRR